MLQLFALHNRFFLSCGGGGPSSGAVSLLSRALNTANRHDTNPNSATRPQRDIWHQIAQSAENDPDCFRHVVDVLYTKCVEGNKHPPADVFQKLVRLCVRNSDRDAMLKLVHVSWRTDLHLDLRELQQEIGGADAQHTCQN